MGISIRVSARKQMTANERQIITAFNLLAANGVEASQEHKDKIVSILGRELEWWDEPLTIDLDNFVELPISGEGYVMEGEGMIISMDDLPPGTIELRIFARA